ncbi:hypothetical protein NHX12_022169 [Muraenolepis orangiensis]|uniref:Uncharacterized protein n=1 Tax=Muraenolepis orangiensis TaxID=630683 RepID=A0A9Q0ITT2_9TELE|nr:hypothetical protein NHX12_022169 [Muraenolepis orangiensis]
MTNYKPTEQTRDMDDDQLQTTETQTERRRTMTNYKPTETQTERRRTMTNYKPTETQTERRRTMTNYQTNRNTDRETTDDDQLQTERYEGYGGISAIDGRVAVAEKKDILPEALHTSASGRPS